MCLIIKSLWYYITHYMVAYKCFSLTGIYKPHCSFSFITEFYCSLCHQCFFLKSLDLLPCVFWPGKFNAAIYQLNNFYFIFFHFTSLRTFPSSKINVNNWQFRFSLSFNFWVCVSKMLGAEHRNLAVAFLSWNNIKTAKVHFFIPRGSDISDADSRSDWSF